MEIRNEIQRKSAVLNVKAKLTRNYTTQVMIEVSSANGQLADSTESILSDVGEFVGLRMLLSLP